MKVKWHPPYESGSDLTNSESDGPPGLAEDSSDENDCINTDIPADAEPKARDEWKLVSDEPAPNGAQKCAPKYCNFPQDLNGDNQHSKH